MIKECKSEDCINKVKKDQLYCARCLIEDDGYIKEWEAKVETVQ